MANYKEFAIANIDKIVIKPKDGETMEMSDFVTEAECLAYVDEGEETVLRTKTTVKATNKTEDLLLGYDITLQGSTVVPELLALIDGGTWDAEAQKYEGTKVGTATKREEFDMEIWTEEKGCDGESEQYMVFDFYNCTGAPLNYSLQDGEFFIPELTIKSRPKCGKSPASFRIEKAEE